MSRRVLYAVIDTWQIFYLIDFYRDDRCWTGRNIKCCLESYNKETEKN